MAGAFFILVVGDRACDVQIETLYSSEIKVSVLIIVEGGHEVLHIGACSFWILSFNPHYSG